MNKNQCKDNSIASFPIRHGYRSDPFLKADGDRQEKERDKRSMPIYPSKISRFLRDRRAVYERLSGFSKTTCQISRNLRGQPGEIEIGNKAGQCLTYMEPSLKHDRILSKVYYNYISIPRDFFSSRIRPSLISTGCLTSYNPQYR